MPLTITTAAVNANRPALNPRLNWMLPKYRPWMSPAAPARAAAMKKVIAQLWPKRSGNCTVATPGDAITLASIVEKETAKPDERPMVAGVYCNRLKIGMKLDADPTVIYPVTQGKPLGRRILKSELDADNPYNTYKRAGLPPGPIANPGRLLSVTQVGVKLASLGLGWAGEETVYNLLLAGFHPAITPATEKIFHGLAFVLSFLVISYFHVVVGEVLPKNLAIAKADRLAVLVAPALLVVRAGLGRPGRLFRLQRGGMVGNGFSASRGLECAMARG